MEQTKNEGQVALEMGKLTEGGERSLLRNIVDEASGPRILVNQTVAKKPRPARLVGASVRLMVGDL